MTMISGTSGDDTLDGTSTEDFIFGGAGDDALTGGEGNDTVAGGAGNDVAIYAGNQVDYEFSVDARGIITIRDLNVVNGNEGADILTGIQTVRFADGDVSIAPSQKLDDFQVNTRTNGPQEDSSVTALANGSFLVTWMSASQTETGGVGTSDIFGQLYDEKWVAQGSEFRINSTVSHDQTNQQSPSVAALTDSGFVVTWATNQSGWVQGIHGQRFDASGVAQGNEFQVNAHVTLNDSPPSVGALPDGGFLVTWSSGSLEQIDTYGQRYDASGVALGAEFQINTSTLYNQAAPSIAVLANGGYVVTWTSYKPNGDDEEVFGQQYDASGLAQGDEFQVNTYTTGAQAGPAVAALSDGGYVVAWMSQGQDGGVDEAYMGYLGIFAQRYDASGAAQGSEFQVNTYSDNYQTNPSIAGLASGGFVVTWQSTVPDSENPAITTSHIYGQLYAVNGVPLGNEFLVNTSMAFYQALPSVSASLDGGFVVTWASGGQDGSSTGVYVQRYDADGTAAGGLTLTGSSGDDHLTVAVGSQSATIIGLAGNDVARGGSGSDLIVGGDGAGDDTYIGGTGIDEVKYVSAITGITVNLALGTASGNEIGNDKLSGIENIIGGQADDNIIGNGGPNRLDGYTGSDTLAGGGGDDVFIVDNEGDTVKEDAGAGTDRVQSSVNFTLGANVEYLFLTGGNGISGTGNVLANVITGNGGDNTLDGRGGADTLIGGDGNDIYIVDSVGDIITETEGNDTILSSVSYSLIDTDGAGLSGGNVENLTLIGTGDINATGNAGSNILIGNSGNNVLNGGDGYDRMDGGSGSDVYLVALATDRFQGEIADSGVIGNDEVRFAATILDAGSTLTLYVEDTGIERVVIGTGTAATAVTSGTMAFNVDAHQVLNGLVITGNAGANTLTGTGYDDQIIGGLGNDILVGGAGDDTYVTDNALDSVTENDDEGTDTVQSAVAWTLSANVENLALTGTAAIDATGNGLDNRLTGNAAANTLNGMAGADTMTGGDGADTYVVDDAGDRIVETNALPAGGLDLVQSALSFILGDNLERLTLTGTAAIDGSGNALANVITGNAGNNRLDGGAGADTLTGGLGDDLFVVDLPGDVVTELAEGGTDAVLVRSALAGGSFILGANIEYGTLGGADNLNLTGNGSNNGLLGNSGANLLDGGIGNDALQGGGGNDTLLGGAGNDSLDGRQGSDRMEGGAGNDTYYVNRGDGAGTAITANEDTVVELAATGTDTVYSAVYTYTLDANVENLVLQAGRLARKGFGNDADNTITGNGLNNTIGGEGGNDTLKGGAGNDTLDGGAGNDRLDGGPGRDILSGGAGADRFVFATTLDAATNSDTITDFVSGTDRIELSASIFTALGAAGALNAAYFHAGATAGDADDHVIFDATTGALYYDPDGIGGDGQVQFATLAGGVAIAVADFVVGV